MKSKVIIVGNSPILKGSGLGQIIDSYDHVVRINNFQIEGHQIDVGTKSDIWSNSLSPAVRKRDCEEIKEIWCSIAPKVYYLLDNRLDRLLRPEEKNKVNLFSLNEFYDFKIELGIENNHNKWPSTGLITIKQALAKFDTVDICGFSFFKEIDSHVKHYYEDPIDINEKTIAHISDIEESYVSYLINKGKLNIIGENRLSSNKSEIKTIVKNVDYYIGLANTYMLAKKFDLAIETLKSQLDGATKKKDKILSKIATCYQVKGQYDLALQFCDQALAINPKFAYALARKGEMLLQNFNDESGLELIHEAIKINPSDIKMYKNLLNAYRYLGDDEGVVNSLILAHKNLDKDSLTDILEKYNPLSRSILKKSNMIDLGFPLEINILHTIEDYHLLRGKLNNTIKEFNNLKKNRSVKALLKYRSYRRKIKNIKQSLKFCYQTYLTYRKKGPYELIICGDNFHATTGLHKSITAYANHKIEEGSNYLFIDIKTDFYHKFFVNFLKKLSKNKSLLFNGISAFSHPQIDHFLHSDFKLSIYLHETEWALRRFSKTHGPQFEKFKKSCPSLKVLCVSKEQEKLLREEYDAQDTHIIYECINICESSKENSAYLDLINIEDQSEVKIIFVGTLQPRKGVDLFSRVADIAKEDGRNWSFTWIGNSRHKAKMYFSPNVRWIGNKYGSDLFDHYKASDIFFLSSYDDPFPVTCLEAFFFEKKIVAYNNTGISSFIDKIRGCQSYQEWTATAAYQALVKASQEKLDIQKVQDFNNNISNVVKFASRIESALELNLTKKSNNITTFPNSTERDSMTTSENRNMKVAL